MGVIQKLRRAVRGEVRLTTAAREAIRRSRASVESRKERSTLAQTAEAKPRLQQPFSRMSPAKLMSHFQQSREAHFLPGFSQGTIGNLQQELFPGETVELLASANRIVNDHCWPLLGMGDRTFGDEIEWCRDLLSGYLWPLVYHCDIQLIRGDGSDVRVLWELNRLGHLITLTRAYAVTNDDRFSNECFRQLRSWATQNPYGRGVNWTCAMEVALRSMNLLAVFEVLRHSPVFDSESLWLFLKLFHQHGTFIKNNLEFSYIATSNHYLSDVAGLLWLGLMLPEFCDSENWCDLGVVELLREMDKQVLPDGADFESSTGYHRFVSEVFLYSFVLCRQNDVEIESKYWDKLQAMLHYIRGYLRPDGLAPLIGDSDSGQVLPISRRRADDHAYVLAIGAAIFSDAGLLPSGVDMPQELLWIMGDEGVRAFRSLPATTEPFSSAFPDAGTYVMRKRDLYLCLNASGAGLNGRGSHGHNDALSLEVSARGRPFIVDPGTYVYSADLRQRHLFRSTAYHSTVKIDNEEQNTTLESVPFVIGDEAHPRVLVWETGPEFDRVVAEHSGYTRLASPVTHRRSVTFDKTEEEWLIEDEFFGDAEHDFEVWFHFAPGLELTLREASVIARDIINGVALSVHSLDLKSAPALEKQAISRDYGELIDSVSACWRLSGRPGKLRWKLQVSNKL
jgi:Heparinase II/III-like protein/Heparinase II/III N-terminus